MLLNEMNENLYECIIDKLILNGIGKAIKITFLELCYLKSSYNLSYLLENIREHFNNLNLNFVFDNKNNLYII